MQINELFYSIQGEGIYAGIPHTFIRFAGCNLNCKWCDTKYAWGEGKEVDVEYILNEIKDYPTRFVCITGGEPLTQDIFELCRRLDALGYIITVETNCTFYDQKLTEFVDLWSLSPKLSSSGNSPQPEILIKYMLAVPEKVQIKFVIADKRDYAEALQLLGLILDADLESEATPIVFQPEYYSNTLKDLVEMVLADRESLKKYNIRILPQIHKLIWGEQRGK